MWIVACHKNVKKGMLLLLCFGTISFSQANPTFADTFSAVITYDDVSVRTGPGLQYDEVVKVNKGDEYTVLKEENGWNLVSLPNNKQGWISNWMMDKSDDSVTEVSSVKTIRTVESTVTNLNVRTGPSVSYDPLKKINPGQTYLLVEEQEEWVKIELSTKEQGWVAKWLVTINNENQKEPTIIPSSPTLNKLEMKVTATTLFIRSGPGTTNQSIGKLKQGDIVTVNKTENDWHQITYNNMDGWISAEFTEKVQTNTNQSNDHQQEDSKEDDQSSELLQVKIVNTGTNLREGPSLQHKVVSTGQEGELYPVIETSGEWFKVKLTDGKEAYIAGWVVTQLNTNNTSTPPTEVSSPNMLRGKRIVIDPCHGGRDSGAIGSQYKTYEKDINLTVSKILAAKLEAAGATVVLSRSIDQSISLQDRVDLSIAKRADAFISIHHNTNFNSNVNGTIIYYYSNGRDRDLAQIIQSEVVKRNGLNNMGARQGNFFVLRENPQLAILVELAFLSNKKDEGTARSSDFQEQSAEGIFQGLNKYFNTL